MPIYEYECSVCGRFEAVQKISEAPLKAQTNCTRENCPRSAERLISAAAFHLKGSGWYKTDYAAGGAGIKEDAGTKKEDKKEAASSNESKTETKKETVVSGESKPAKVEKKEPNKAAPLAADS